MIITVFCVEDAFSEGQRISKKNPGKEVSVYENCMRGGGKPVSYSVTTDTYLQHKENGHLDSGVICTFYGGVKRMAL